MEKSKKQIGKNIVLIGLMGSGKSVLGRKLSKSLKYKFYDSDKSIEKFTGTSIIDIFEKFGENYFREVEEKIVIQLLAKQKSVISLGGGSILSPIIRKTITEKSMSIYLKVDIDILVERLSKSYKRPLLKGANIKNKLSKLYEERKIFYNKSNIIIENNDNVGDVINLLKNKIDLNE